MDDQVLATDWKPLPLWRKALYVGGAVLIGGLPGAMIGYWIGFAVASVASHVILFAAVVFVGIGPVVGIVGGRGLRSG